jgi:hypothetical protein
VGGLIGTILGFIFIMNAYSERAYGISIASQLFVTDEGTTISSDGFHIGYLVTLAWTKICEVLNCCTPGTGKTELYSKCLDEIDEQLDISHIMKKLLFLERGVTAMLSEHQLEALHARDKQTLSEAEVKRKRYELTRKVRPRDGDDNEDDPSFERERGGGADALDSKVVVNLSGEGQSMEEIGEQMSAASISSIGLDSKARLKASIREVI